MDSTADARDTKRARLTPSAGDVDLISGLDDDVLLRILKLVAAADATGAVHTGALSRRWRAIWTRVPALRFASLSVPREASVTEGCAALERYVSFVNDVLARRAQSGDALESLDISCAKNKRYLPSPPPSIYAAQGWIRYAFQHGVKSFILNLPPILCGPMVVLDEEIPSPTKLETMRLAFGCLTRARLQLPTTMKFASSLTDLSLQGIDFVSAGSVHSLSHLVSSVSCPRLHKLYIANLSIAGEIRIEADVLSELSVKYATMKTLELRTPRLRVLHMHNCKHKVFRVSAIRLEELTLVCEFQYPAWLLEVDGDFPCVWRLKICLWSYHPPNDALSYAKAVNDNSKLLLKLCDKVTCLQVELYGQKEHKDVEIFKSRIPHLPHVTSLTVNVSIPMEWHDFGSSIAILLTRFVNLRRLSLHFSFYLCMSYEGGKELDLGCYHLEDHWISNEISMSHLQEVELTGLIGTDCEIWLMKYMFKSARGIRKVVIHFNSAKYLQHQVEMQMDAFECMLLNEGMWISHRGALNLTCLK